MSNNTNVVNLPSNNAVETDLVLDIKQQAIDEEIAQITALQNQMLERKAQLEKQRVRNFMHKAVDVTCDNTAKGVVLGVKGTKGAAYYFGITLEYTGYAIVKVAQFISWVSNKVKAFSSK